jgi:5-methyltetrahydropteroyltriglutamate--homocysteine methyltransferase
VPIPTEPIGSIPRPASLIEASAAYASGQISNEALETIQDEALRDTVRRFEDTGSPVITDGEQMKPSFIGYPIAGIGTLAPDGVVIPFADGHTRQLPRLTEGPFRYRTFADAYLAAAKEYATRPIKQAVIAASAMSLLYPAQGIDGYPRDEFVADLISQAVADIRRSLDAGAHVVQIDFTEGRLACKLDPSLGLLRSFVELNNRVLSHFTDEERARIGVHTCPGGDLDSTHSADVDYALLLPDLLRLNVGTFYLQMASEPDRPRALGIIRDHARPRTRIFIGVIDPIDTAVESPEQVRDRILEAAEIIPVDQLGTCVDCGFSPFGDDTSTARETAFEKIRSRVLGTELASKALGL